MAGLKVESHHVRFRHNTEDAEWLEIVGEKKWIVLTRDAMIGRRLLELDALLAAGTRVFVVVSKEFTDEASANIVIAALRKILDMIAENNFPFIAKIHKNSAVQLGKRNRKFTRESTENGHKKTKTTKAPSDEYQRFERLAKALIAVPTSEIDKRHAEYARRPRRNGRLNDCDL